jgi:hypothetical protein
VQSARKSIVDTPNWSRASKGWRGDLSTEDRKEVHSLMRAKAEVAKAIAEQRAATIVGLR